jgi:pyruvate dehydrogenase E2 component (dihydrolipoamide acetyltransferase)
MAKIAEMTQLSPTMSEGTIVNWLKKVGDTIAPGDILAEVETDKAVMEMEAYESGILLAILAEPGKKVAVGLPVAILGTANEDIAGLLNEAKNKLAIASSSANTPSLTKEPSKDQEAPAAIAIPTNLSSTNTQSSKPENSQMSTPPDKEENSSSVGKIENANQGKKITPITGRILASPLAKNLALEKSVDLKSIQGTGPGGRILESDVRAYLENPNHIKSSSSSKKMPQDHEIAVSGMRKVIAERLTSSKVNLPHFYLNIEVDADALVLFRERFNRSLLEIAPAESNSKISINDCIVKATSLSLKYHPKVNSSWKKDKILEWGRIDIGIAVSIEDGLITPVIRNANTSSLLEISQEIKSLADRAKKRKLKPEEFTNSTFTISNLGMYGISFFTAIINEPESAILAVGSIEEKPVVRNGMIQVGKILSLTLSCDHRVVDGAEGAKFLATLRKHLENPELLAS